MLTLGAVDVRVIEERPDGKGGVIEIPILPETPFIDFGASAGGGKEGSLTIEHLREMAANFVEYPGPITVGAGSHDRNASDAAPAFMESAELRGNTLWARIDMGPELFRQVVYERSWRGYSIEAVRNLKKPTKQFTGWVLTGGIFTNTPATDVHFRIAASESESHRGVAHITLALSGIGDDIMADNDVALLRAENEEKDQKIAALSADLEAATAKLEAAQSESEADRAALEARLDTLASDHKELATKYQEAQDAKLAAEVESVIADAIDKGVDPALFEGAKDNAVAWFTDRYKTVGALQEFVSALRPAENTPTQSGSALSAGVARLTAAQIAQLKASGLDPEQIVAEIDNPTPTALPKAGA